MADDEKPKNKGGRPRKHPVGNRVPTLAFRVRSGLRAKLAKSAEENERSISEEIEQRLEQSFAVEAEAGGSGNLRLVRLIAATISGQEELLRGSLAENWEVSVAVKRAVAEVLEVILPKAPAGLLHSQEIASLETVGQRTGLAFTKAYIDGRLKALENKMREMGDAQDVPD